MAFALAAPELQTRKGLGRLHLNSNRIAEAVQTYAGILREYPDDIESNLRLGDCYLAGGDASTAADLYACALRLDPVNPEVDRRLGLARAECSQLPVSLAEPVPTDPGAVARLLQRLTGRRTPVTEAEIGHAAAILEAIVTSSQPAQAVADRLPEIDSLLPALLELNIRQAEADGRPDLVEGLEHLLQNICLQLDGASLAGHLSPAKVLLLGPAVGETQLRHEVAAEALRASGCETVLADRLEPGDTERFDVIVAALSASLDAELEDQLARFAAEPGRRLVVDVAGETGSRLVSLAHRVGSANRAVAAGLRERGVEAAWLPHGWSQGQQVWDQSAPPRDTINVGWLWGTGQLEDVAEIRRQLLRAIREHPQARLVIAGDPQIYNLFEALPESRRALLPAVDYPTLLAQIDVLLVPVRDGAGSDGQSDFPLMACGVRGIPWVASSHPAFEDWGAGGRLALSAGEWHDHLHELLADSAERQRLGQAGRHAAQARELQLLRGLWTRLVLGDG